MEPFMEHTIPVAWSDIGGMNKGHWAFHEGSSFMPEMMECAGGAPVAHESSSSPSHVFVQHMKPHGPMHIFEDSPDSALPAPALNQEDYAAMRGVSAGMTSIPNMQEPLQCTTNPLIARTSPPLPPQTAFPTFPRGYGRDRSNTTRTWCQSFINGPRERTMPSDRDSPGEASQDEVDGRNREYDVQFYGSSGAIHLGLPPMQADGQQHHQMQGDQVYMPLFETHSGVAQHQGPASMVTGAARPRVRARRGQATDPHSIAERLRRERIAERMKALQELVPNANKTDKASMLDEIIDYVKFLQLQVKVLSMSRLGGTGAVAPFMTDFPAEGQSSLAAALGPMPSFHDTMVIAERQVARLMEEDMGSAMQFLQAKGLCLMPVSLAGVVSSNDSRMVANTGGGGGQQQAVSAMLDQSRMHAASSSTTSTLASVASSSCAGGEGDSKSKQQ